MSSSTPTQDVLAFCSATRTTFNIVSSCLVTIIACTWVAIHPNVPRSPETWWRAVLRRSTIMFCAVVAPEFIIWWALRQWKGAKALQRQFANHDKKITWTLAHAHFLQMGGFMLCSSERTPLEVLSQPTLTHLLDTGQITFPNLSEAEIQDKSKGDVFAKTIAVLQTLWFVVQTVARGIQKLPISELEIVTLGYAVLNGAVYFLWWHKPLNVACPVLMPLKPNAEYYKTVKEKKARAKELPELPEDTTGVDTQQPSIEQATQADKPNSDTTTSSSPDDSDLFSRIPYPLQIIGGLFLVLLIPALALALLGIGLALGAALLGIAIAIAIPCVAFAAAIIPITLLTQAPLVLVGVNIGSMMFSDEVGPGALHVSTYYAYNPTPRDQLHTSKFLGSSASNGDSEAQKKPSESEGTGYDDNHLLICGSLAIVFGAIHCIAWSFHFNTPTESVLWRTCALSVTCVPLVYMIDTIMRTLSGLTHRSQNQEPGFRFSGKVVVNIILVLCWNLYAFARLGLLLLALVGLRHMPMEMFLTVRWTEFVPHF